MTAPKNQDISYYTIGETLEAENQDTSSPVNQSSDISSENKESELNQDTQSPNLEETGTRLVDTQPEGMDYKKYFQANLLDGDEIQDGQMIASTEVWPVVEEIIAAAEERGVQKERANWTGPDNTNPKTGIPYIWYREDKVETDIATAEKRTIERVREKLPKKKPEECFDEDDGLRDREEELRNYSYNQALQEVNDKLNSITNEE